jgi:hypothetical protein
MNPEEPFYFLDDGQQPIPSLSYPMLNECLAIHVFLTTINGFSRVLCER